MEEAKLKPSMCGFYEHRGPIPRYELSAMADHVWDIQYAQRLGRDAEE